MQFKVIIYDYVSSNVFTEEDKDYLNVKNNYLILAKKFATSILKCNDTSKY